MAKKKSNKRKINLVGISYLISGFLSLWFGIFSVFFSSIKILYNDTNINLIIGVPLILLGIWLEVKGTTKLYQGR